MKEPDRIKLKEWINNISDEKRKEILQQCIVDLYYDESVRISEEGIPYWISSGDNLGE